MQFEGYSLKVNGVNVDPFIDASRIRPFSERAEGEKMWEYWFSAITATLDISCFDALGINKNTYVTLHKAEAQLYQHNNLLLNGTVLNPEYDTDRQEIVLPIHSHGRVVKDIKLGEYFKNIIGDGDTDVQVVFNVASIVNVKLAEQGYNFRIGGTDVATKDFSFYRSINITEIDISKYAKSHFIGMGKGYQFGTQLYDTFMLMFQGDATGDNLTGQFGFTITESGVNFSHVYPRSSPNGQFIGPLPGSINDEGLLRVIESQLRLADSYEFLGSCQFGDRYYVCLKDYPYENPNKEKRYFLQCDINQTDKFIFDYKQRNVTAGYVLRDLAQMKNAIFHIASDDIIYLQSRDGVGVLAEKNFTNLKSRVVEKDREFNIPEAYILLNVVRDAVVEYFNRATIGRFKQATATFDAGEFLPSEYPLMMKRLPIGNTNNMGIINAVEYLGDQLVIETEEYIAPLDS